MQRLCDLCDNPPKFKCEECKAEMIEVAHAQRLWWPAVAMQVRRPIVTAGGITPPSDFMYV